MQILQQMIECYVVKDLLPVLVYNDYKQHQMLGIRKGCYRPNAVEPLSCCGGGLGILFVRCKHKLVDTSKVN